MDLPWQALPAGLPDAGCVGQALCRLAAAGVLGTAIGLQRRGRRDAAVRTPALACLGAALLALAVAAADLPPWVICDDRLWPVVERVLAFLDLVGAGAVVRLERERHIHRLTAAAGVWMAGAIGLAAGSGHLGIALPATAAAVALLRLAVPGGAGPPGPPHG